MLFRLILIFTLVPLADLILLLSMAQYTGWQISLLLVIVSGIIGAYLARRSSSAVASKIRERFAQGQVGADLLTDGAMILFAAGLLLTPGFITDFVGLTILIPFCRQWYKNRLTAWVKRNFKVHVVSGGMGPMGNPFDPNTVDGSVVDPNRDENDFGPDELEVPQKIEDRSK